MTKAYRADILEENAKAAKKKQAYSSVRLAILSFAIALLLFFTLHFFISDLPKLSSEQELWTTNRSQSMEVVDNKGNTIAHRGPRYGRQIDIDKLPRHVLLAFLAVEDARFFEHAGVDLWAVARAIVQNARAGHKVQGASTITQQLIKNIYLSPEQTYKRKIQEMILAWQLDSKFPKKTILEVYLNRIYFGQNAYGLDAAAWQYFSKRPSELTLGEAAMLAGLPKAPGRLSQDLTAKPAVDRRAIVLERMVTAGFISVETAQRTSIEPVALKKPVEPSEGEFAYAIDMAQKEISAIEPKISPDQIVRLTIDSKLQDMAVTTVQAALARTGSSSGVTQAGLIAMDKSGRILAIVGGQSYSASKFNRVTQAKRQPGSTFKPFVYAAALEAGMGPDTIRVDKPVKFGNWRPKNYGGNYAGSMTLSTALTRSVNTIAAQLASEVGVDKLITISHRLGINSELKRNLAISLGAGEVTLWDMTRAYATFANDGVRLDPFLIDRIDTTRNTIAFQRRSHIPTQVYDPMRARQMTAMLADVIEFGTGKRAKLLGGREAAGKTGTSQSYRDAWFVGYTADIICGVWVGNDEFTPMRGVSGGTLPAQIWSSFMNKAHEGLPLKPLPTIYDANQPDNKTMALYYEDLAKLFAAAGGIELDPLKEKRQANTQNAISSEQNQRIPQK